MKMYLSPPPQSFKLMKITFVLFAFLSFVMISCEKEVMPETAQNQVENEDVNAALLKKGELGNEKAVKGPPSNCLCQYKVISATDSDNIWSVEEAANDNVVFGATNIGGEGDQWIGPNGLEPLESDWETYDEPQLKIAQDPDFDFPGSYTVTLRCVEIYPNGGTYLVGSHTETHTFVSADNGCIYWDLPLVACNFVDGM